MANDKNALEPGGLSRFDIELDTTGTTHSAIIIDPDGARNIVFIGQNCTETIQRLRDEYGLNNQTVRNLEEALLNPDSLFSEEIGPANLDQSGGSDLLLPGE